MNTPPKTYSAGQTGSFKPAHPTDTLADAANSAIDSVKSTVGDAVDRGQAAFSQASAAANEMAGSAKQQVTTFASELEAMTRRNPLGTVAGAVMAGVLIGLLARRRN
jgi:ElaB/YqjD/DUF883 family membrane-anchored ribosome-binding protein